MPENYRPITLRHMILNILDRWLQLKLTQHFETNNSYQAQQYGFTPKIDNRTNKQPITNLRNIKQNGITLSSSIR